VVLSVFGENIDSIEGSTIIVALLHTVRLLVQDHKTILGFTLGVSSIFLYNIPSIGIAVTSKINVIPILLGFYALSDLIAYAARKSKIPIRKMNFGLERPKDGDYILWVSLLIWCSASGFFMPPDSLSRALSFTIPYSLSLVIFEKIIRADLAKYRQLLMLLLYALTLATHIIFFWSGYGRLVIASLIMMPIFLLQSYRDIGLRLWKVILLSPPLLYLAQMSRYGEFTRPEEYLVGSNGHHLIVTKEAIAISSIDPRTDWSGFFDQYILLFLNWLPRELWPNKPLGAGWLSVEKIYGREGYGDGFSLSLGFIGEQYYLLSSYFFVGVIIVITSLACIRAVISKISCGFLAPIIVFDVSLISYIWGGSATFGSRVWFLLFPALFFAFSLRLRLTSHVIQAIHIKP